jgi:hypothetical protein
MFFKKKKKCDNKKVFIIPREHTRKMMILHDTHKETGSLVAKYDLWSVAIELFPEVEHGSWVMSFDNATTIILKKKETA